MIHGPLVIDMGQRDQLPIPAAAKADAHSREMMRAWVAAKGLHCSLNVGMWSGDGSVNEADAWGILLADVARHVANALEESESADAREVVLNIRDSFNMELDHPTSAHPGGFVD